jgi:sec-independent protein translocase protein TatC
MEDGVVVPPPPAPAKAAASKGIGQGSTPPPPPPPLDDDDDDEDEEDDEDGMLRMSFMDHLEELRSRIIAVLIGTGIAFAAAFALAIPLWNIVQVPLREAVDQYGGQIVALSPGEQFSIIWMWNPLLAAVFMAAPWVIYQIWAFIAPGLYPNERKWAAPFIIITAGLFIAGGAFAYFVAFRFAMVFLLGIGAPTGVTPMISIERYFTTFVNVILGVSILFELPVVVFFLTLLRITTPGFLIRNARYAILAIVVLAAVVTPTPDPVNLAIFAIPMILLFFLGVFASYLLVLHREGERFPWKIFFIWILVVLAMVAIVGAIAVGYYGYLFVPQWPFLVRP